MAVNPWDFETLRQMLDGNRSQSVVNPLVRTPSVGPLEGLELMNPPAMDRSPAAAPAKPMARVPAARKSARAPMAADQSMIPDRITPEDTLRLKSLFDSQQEGVDRLRAAAENYAAGPDEINLAPLLALSDSWTGGNLSKSYQAPPSQDERAINAQKLRAAAADAQNNLTKDRVSVFNAGNKDEAAMLRTLLQAQNSNAVRNLSSDVKEQMLTYKKEQDLQSQLTKEIEKPLEDQVQLVSNIDNALQSNDYQQVWGSLSNLARLMGEKGVLTDKDITRLMPSNVYGTAAAIRSYFNSTPSTKMDPKYVAGLQKLVANARQVAVSRYKSQLAGKRKKYESMSSVRELMMPGAAGDQMFGAIESRLGEFGAPPEAAKPKEVDQKDWDAATPEERSALLEHFSGGKKK